jgi:Kef-type K+ transport system membrane component KefB
MQQIELLGNGLFIPIFAISIGVLSNPRVLFSHPENLGVAAIVVAGAVGAKFLAAWGTGKLFHYHFASIMTIFGLTMSRSALVLVIALFGKTSGLLSEGFFNAIVVYILVTCLIGPFITSIWGKAIARG